MIPLHSAQSRRTNLAEYNFCVARKKNKSLICSPALNLLRRVGIDSSSLCGGPQKRCKNKQYKHQRRYIDTLNLTSRRNASIKVEFPILFSNISDNSQKLDFNSVCSLAGGEGQAVELQTKVCEDFTIMENALTGRGLLRDCEIFANLRLKLQWAVCHCSRGQAFHREQITSSISWKFN